MAFNFIEFCLASALRHLRVTTKEPMKNLKTSLTLGLTCAALAGSVVAMPQTAQAREHRSAGFDFNDHFGFEDAFFGSGGFFNFNRWTWWWSRFFFGPGWNPGGPGAVAYADLPKAVSIEGDCNFRSPCHIVQDEDEFKLNCRPRRGVLTVYNGKSKNASRIEFTKEDGSQECKGRWSNNAWRGTCKDLATEENPEPSPNKCAFNFNEEPEPVAYAEQLPNYIDRITACGQTFEGCTSIQEDASAMIKCDSDDGESTYLTASVVDKTVSLVLRPDGKYFRCRGEWDGHTVSGSCLQRGRNLENPETCDDYAIEAHTENPHGTCAQVLPQEGFTLQGCGMDSTCIAVQRGCEWQLNCGDEVYTGRTNRYRPNQLRFTNKDGKQCKLRVGRDGKISGSCSERWGRNRCLVRSTAPEAPNAESCFTMPTQVSTQGCGAFWNDCKIYQDGCSFQTICESGRRNFTGTITGNSIEFAGLADYTCNAELTEQDGKKRLLGACTRQNDDGTVSECRDLTERFGARLAIDWEQ